MDMKTNEGHFTNNQPQQLRRLDRTAVKLGQRNALAGLRPVGLEPIGMQNIVIRVRAAKVATPAQ